MKNQGMQLGLSALLMILGLTARASPEIRDAGKTYRAIVRTVPESGETLRVRIFDSTTSLPLESATVLIGERAGIPFAGNIAATGSGGGAEFRAAEIATAAQLSVTAHKAGYQALTIQATRGREVDLFLAPDPRIEAFHFLRGTFTGWPTGIGRTQVEIGLFLPAFRASTILNFDLSQIVSTYKEEIRVLGQAVKVPGNFVLPPQDKVYNFIPVHLEKPNYAMPLASDTQTHMSAIVGDAALASVVTEIRAKDFLAAVNHVNFTKLQWSTWTSVTGDAALNINASRQLAAQSLTSRHGALPPELDLVVFSMLDPTGEGRALVPMDIKSRAREVKDTNGAAESTSAAPSLLDRALAWWSTETKTDRREVKLTSLTVDPQGAKSYVFSALVDQKQFAERPVSNLRFSVALSPVTLEGGRKVAQTDKYLGLATLKSVSADRREFAFEFSEEAANAPEYLVLNLVVVAKDEALATETRRLVWTTILPPGARSLRLPELPGVSLAAGPGESLLWEVLAIRRGLAKTDGLWDSVVTIENLKQLSHSIQAL